MLDMIQLCSKKCGLVIAQAGRLALLLAVLGSGCRMKTSETHGESKDSPEAAELPRALPKTDSRYLTGGEGRFALADLKGRVVLADVTALWSEPCRRDIPELNRWHEQLSPQGLAVIGIAVDTGTDVAGAARQSGAIYPMVQGNTALLNAVGQPRALPTRILIDRKGTVRKTFAGAVPLQDVHAELLSILQEG